MNPSANNFPQLYQFPEYSMEYINFREICQGGPEVGNLIVNSNNFFPKLEFGGPLYFYNSMIYIPQFVKHGFILVEIDIINKSIKQISEFESLILIKEVKDNIIYYFNDYECQNMVKIELKLYNSRNKKTTFEKITSFFNNFKS